MGLLLAALIGILAGLRSLTAPAVTAWVVWLGWLQLDPLLAFVGSPITVMVFTILAVAELVVDKLPRTPSRTAPLGLVARICTGALTGACVASGAGHGVIPGAALGAVGGVLGAFGGYWVRTRLVKALGTRDLVVAVMEDLLAVAGSLWAVSRF
jgi:uncharacterized membrane protein